MKYKLRIALALVALILVSAGIYFGFGRIKITNIVCTSQFGPCSSSLNSDLDKFRGTPVLGAISTIKKNLSTQSKIYQHSLRYSIPSTINIYVVEKKGQVALGKQGFEGFVVLDKDGNVISIEKSSSLPIINVANNQDITIKPGSKVSDNLFFAEQIERNVFTAYGIKLAILYTDRIEAKIENGPKVIFPIDGEVDVLMGSLNLILSHLNNANSEIRMGEIDLRYKNPVIR